MSAPAVRIDEIDLATVGPCPSCGTPVRRLGVPIAGSGLDLVFADQAWCSSCLQAKVVEALVAAGLEPGQGPIRPRPVVTLGEHVDPVRVHAPPKRVGAPGAFCRYIGHATTTDVPAEVTCIACKTKVDKYGWPRPA